MEDFFLKAGLTPLGGVVFDLTRKDFGFKGLEKFAYPWAGVSIGWTINDKNRPVVNQKK